MSAPGVCLNIIKERQESDGLGTLKNPKKFLNQDYELLHQYYLIRNRRYIDDMFPPDNSSIGEKLLKAEDLARVEWIRPTSLVPNPYLFIDGVSRFDFAQGSLGNCWFLAAVGALTFQRDIIQRVFPTEQSFQKNYAGIFHFRFWRFGKWVDVVIDDKLPTINGQLIFVRPQSPTTPQSPGIAEFWPALLEKAYAKVCGSYEDMAFGWVSEAMKDFTGGVHMTLDLQNESSQNVFDQIYRAAKANSLMGCGTRGNAQRNPTQNNGLVEGHAYTVTGVTKVTSNGNQVQLVRLLNPWGHTEWNGNWSDGSKTWLTVTEEERKTYARFGEDGEFWMSVEDFCKNFFQLDICNSTAAFLDGTCESHWNTSVIDGRWISGCTAGGPMTGFPRAVIIDGNCTEKFHYMYPSTLTVGHQHGAKVCRYGLQYGGSNNFWTNPQFPVKITEINRACEPVTKQEPNILVCLMQKPDKRNRRLTRNLHLGISIFKRTSGRKDSTGTSTCSLGNPVYYTKVMIDSREITEFTRLESGDYIIIPYTSVPNKTASFILSLCSKTETQTGDPCMVVSPDEIIQRQLSDHYQEMNAEQLQRFLNENYVGGGTPSTGGFSLDACQSIVAIMDISVTGTLSASEFNDLLKRIELYKRIFFGVDNNRDGILSLTELRHALDATGFQVSDKLLKLITLRFADSTGRITLPRFICLALRVTCMSEIFKKLADRHSMNLKEHEWLYLTMYS